MRIKPSKDKINPHTQKLKPFKIPDGLVVRVDSREQDPLFTKLDDYTGQLSVQIQKLTHGDYSIKGFEDKFAIERKQMSDFYSYIGKERKRTIKKMEKFGEIVKAGGFVALVIETSEEEILSGNMYSKLTPEVARQFLNVWRIRFGLHVYMNKHKKSVERFVLDSMIRFYMEMRKT